MLITISFNCGLMAMQQANLLCSENPSFDLFNIVCSSGIVFAFNLSKKGGETTTWHYAHVGPIEK
jgi:hypothetical protein